VISPLPDTRYADGGDGYVAYQVFGDGAPLVFMTGWLQNLDVMWEEPSLARYFERLAWTFFIARENDNYLHIVECADRSQRFERLNGDNVAAFHI
jgi:hypothetical protein